MGFRLLDQNPVYFNNDGTVCSGGEIRVYANLTTTPENAAEGEDLTPSLGSTIKLDASGRAEDDIWISTGPVRVRLYDADGVMQWSRDYVQDGATAGITPLDPTAGTEDQVYSTDGTDALWRTIIEVPDPTGNSGKYVGTDGTAISWTAFPAATVYDADNLPGGFTQDNDSEGSVTWGNIRLQWGVSSAPTSATVVTTKAITFHTAFSGTPYYTNAVPTSGGVTSDTPSAQCSSNTTTESSTGATFRFFAGAEDEGSGSTAITSVVAFKWVSIGPK